MTGETPQAQPGGRTPAPGPLALVQAFLNTHYDLDVDHGSEVWSSPEAYARWLARQGLLSGILPVSAAEHARALRVRAALRAVASGDDDEAVASALRTMNKAAHGAPVEIRFRPPDGPAFEADGTPASAVGLMLAITAQAMRDGSWERLKICPGRDCGWAFYDHSRNGSGRWCSMAICGGREKARTHYRRNRGDR